MDGDFRHINRFFNNITSRLVGTFCFLSLVIVWSVVATPVDAFAADEISPHRAAYRLELASTRTGSPVVAVSGLMTFEWADACDGWATDQRYVMKLINADELERILKTSFVAWESKDGRRYRFNVKRTRTGGATQNVRGEALIDDSGAGVAKFELPAEKQFTLPTGVQFPTHHLLALMAASAKDSRFEQRMLFDGGSVEGAQPVTAVLLPKRAAKPNDAIPSELARPFIWPMYLAYFVDGDKSGEPDFEMSMDLQSNGVVPRIVLDYGDFKVNGILERLEPLNAPNC
jgi:hypothetical protein